MVVIIVKTIQSQTRCRFQSGTPLYDGNFQNCIDRVRHDANIYNKYHLDGIMLENMHDVPYVQARHLQPETVACMTRLAMEIRSIVPDSTPCGLQILACGNREALAVAKAARLQFIRAEGYVFAHIADEGFTDATAGTLLRYRHSIQADDVLVFSDLKKKHSSHAITGDISLLETANMAAFFLTDAVVLTGVATGQPTSVRDIDEVFGQIEQPVLIGSGVTADTLETYYKRSHGLIVGSHFKEQGLWRNELSEERVANFMATLNNLRACE